MDILFSGELASLAGQTPEALKATLQTEDGEFKEDAAKTFASMVLDKFKAQEREAKEQQYNRGIREAKEAAEKAAKPLFEKFKVNASRFEDAVQELSDKLADGGTPTGTPQELNDEQIATHPAFKKALEARTDEVVNQWKKKLEAQGQEFEQFKAQTHREKVASAVQSATRSILEKDGRQPIYGQKGPDEAIKMFWAYHGLDNVKIEEGKPVLLDKEGNVLRDEMSNPVDFGKFVESNWIGFKEASGDGSPPHNRGRSGGGNAPIRNTDEFKARMEAAKTPQERAHILRAQAEALRKSEK